MPTGAPRGGAHSDEDGRTAVREGVAEQVGDHPVHHHLLDRHPEDVGAVGREAHVVRGMGSPRATDPLTDHVREVAGAPGRVSDGIELEELLGERDQRRNVAGQLVGDCRYSSGERSRLRTSWSRSRSTASGVRSSWLASWTN